MITVRAAGVTVVRCDPTVADGQWAVRRVTTGPGVPPRDSAALTHGSEPGRMRPDAVTFNLENCELRKASARRDSVSTGAGFKLDNR
eukprot:753492-Hanusia_phi.AAC.4